MVAWPARGASLCLVLVLLLLVVVPARAADGGLVHGQGVLWRIEPASGAPSHLFGSVHVTDARVHDLPQPVVLAFEGSSHAAFELLLDAETEIQFARAMILPEGRSLDRLVGADAFRDAVRIGAKYGLSAPALRRLKPWAVTTIFSQPPEEFVRTSGGAQALDLFLQDEAQRLGMGLSALETADEQIGLLDDISTAQQVALFKATVAGHAMVGPMFDAMITSYLARDLDTLHGLMVAQMARLDPAFAARFLERFLHVRNRRMVERMTPLLTEGSAFVVVGALHLPGEQGMLRRLERAGYRVTRIY